MGNCLGLCGLFASPDRSKPLQRIRTLMPDHRTPPKRRHSKRNPQQPVKKALKEVKLLDEPTDDIKEHYDLCEELGRGQFGVIRLCKSRQTGEKFACKSIAKGRLCSHKDIDTVLREIYIMKQLQGHPRVVELKAVYEDRTWVHLVMELCEGGDLFEKIVKQKVHSEEDAAGMCKSLMEAVQFCHSHRIIHRDLKPENILLVGSSPSQIKLADFGLAVKIEPGEQVSATAGSAYYIAPEVLKGEYGLEVDVWSAGVVLYILLCGVPPFWDSTEEGIFEAIRFGHLDLCSDPWPSISTSAKDLIRGMLCPDIRRRLTPEQVLSHDWILKHSREPKQEEASLQQCSIHTLASWCSNPYSFMNHSTFSESSSFLSRNFMSQASSVWDPSTHCASAVGKYTNAASPLHDSDQTEATESDPVSEKGASSRALEEDPTKDIPLKATTLSFNQSGELQPLRSTETVDAQLSKYTCSSVLECNSIHSEEIDRDVPQKSNRLIRPSCSSSALHLQAHPQLVC